MKSLSNGPIRFSKEDIADADDRTEYFLLVRIFWEQPRPLAYVQEALDKLWKCQGTLRIFDAGFGLFVFQFPSIKKKEWVLAHQPWSYGINIMNMRNFVAPTSEVFEDLQFMEITVKLAGIPIDCRTISFGLIMLQPLGYVRAVKFFSAEVEGFCLKGFVTLDLLAARLGREKAIMDGNRELWVYFQYEKVQAICFRCRLIGHVLKRCPNPQLPLDLEARNDWICVEESGEEIDDIFLLKKSEEKKWVKKNKAKLPPAVLKASSASILGGHEFSGQRIGAGNWGGNRQSSLLARSASKNVYRAKAASSTNSSLPSHGNNGVRNTYNRVDNRISEAEAQPTSKRKLTYEEKGKGKMIVKDKKALKNQPRPNGGISIREPTENQRPAIKQRSMPQFPLEQPPPPLFLGKERGVNPDRVSTYSLGFNVPGEGDLELQKSSRNPCSQVPLSELEKAASEFETRKMMLFGQTQKGTGFNPISITDGSPTPSDLKSSARGPEAEFEAEKDDLEDAFLDLDDYADAALEVAETELAGGGSNDKLKDSLEDNEGLFGLMDGCFQDGRHCDDIGKIGSDTEKDTNQEFGLEDLGENTKRFEQGPDSTALFERSENSNFMAREEPTTSDNGNLDVTRNEGNGKLFDAEVEEASLEWPQINK